VVALVRKKMVKMVKVMRVTLKEKVKANKTKINKLVSLVKIVRELVMKEVKMHLATHLMVHMVKTHQKMVTQLILGA